jgi:hypothetical protein
MRMIAPGHVESEDVFHYVKAGGGTDRSSICGKRRGNAKAWQLGRGGKSLCEECAAIAARKYGVT